MENNQRNSRKRLNSLILLVAFTAVMLIVSTYAWFSTQKNVTLTGINGIVKVAEGLQISLDAKHWVNTIDFSHFDQTITVDHPAWTVKASSPTTYLDSSATFQAPATGVTNVVPGEFLPVSTTGYEDTNDGIGQSLLKMYAGTNEETVKLLSDIAAKTENSEAGYFAFDLFLMNTTAGNDPDVLQLDSISDVIGGNESAGVQNTARVAFALYETINDDGDAFEPYAGTNGVAGDADDGALGADMTISGGNALEQSHIIAGTSTGKVIKDIAIWEPNANAHTATIVSSPANSLKLLPADATAYSLPVTNATTGVSTFANGNKLPTYALTSVSLGANKANAKEVAIADVYDWKTPATGVEKQFTLQTDAYIDEDGTAGIDNYRENPLELISVAKMEADPTLDPSDESDDTAFEIAANRYQKVRVYIWMEGQDPDCINAASLGGGLTIDLGFSKPGTEE